MPVLHLSITDHAAVARRCELRASMDAIAPTYNVAHYDDPVIPQFLELRNEWAAIHTTIRQDCPSCGAAHDALWTVRRVVADTMGPWNVYRVHGSGHMLPGGGLPMTLDRVPRDAVRLSPDAMAAFWHAEE